MDASQLQAKHIPDALIVEEKRWDCALPPHCRTQPSHKSRKVHYRVCAIHTVHPHVTHNGSDSQKIKTMYETSDVQKSHDLNSEKRIILCGSERRADVQHFRRRTDVQSTDVGSSHVVG